jgi:hypothetical protein
MIDAQKRIALYYAPPASSAWWREGSEWLGRDAENGRIFDTHVHDLTRAPRRYGWHATIVPPFHCAAGITPDDVLDAARAWARSIARFEMPVCAAQLGRFTALRPAHESDDVRVREMAASALRSLAHVRAAASPESIERRITPDMSQRQIELLREWGYPYVFDEYRFHMTLSDSLDDVAARASIADEWNRRIGTLGPLPMHGAALFIEPAAGAPFTLWQRLSFNASEDAHA